MNIEVENITYDCVEDGVDQSATVLPTLPTTATVSTPTADPHDIQKALEGDWLVTGFDYRVSGSDWSRYDEDMGWLAMARGN
ncbi:hypothetical protein ASE69_07760 [Sphingomonas sp. Leaf208]|uniref:hypothetical protein n=1 Tax=Sphingomonas sp. Leaf208 TaxID=1735679 RepID=UPI0006F9F191|nr:hypothetical protein [Sphingomonas sp. Leaf208]KQM51203.1 hypothetical protein ASE69_07760 [Sphingomonas sp. Leaf208]